MLLSIVSKINPNLHRIRHHSPSAVGSNPDWMWPTSIIAFQLSVVLTEPPSMLVAKTGWKYLSWLLLSRNSSAIELFLNRWLSLAALWLVLAHPSRRLPSSEQSQGIYLSCWIFDFQSTFGNSKNSLIFFSN